MQRTIFSFFLLLLLLLPGRSFAEDRLSGKVVTILQGDTIKVQLEGSKPFVLIYGIACLSKQQTYGERARKFTGDNSYGKTVMLYPKAEPSRESVYGEVVLPNGMNLGHELLRHGLCWWDKKHAAHDKELEQIEAEARNQRLGIWSDPNFKPPEGN